MKRLQEKHNWGNALDYVDLFKYKGDTLCSDGKLSISIHQKETTNSTYIPYKSFSSTTHYQTMFRRVEALCAV